MKKQENLIKYGLIILPVLFMSALAGYTDCISITAWSVEVWDALFSGRLREVYLVCAENFRQAPHGGFSGGILIVLPVAIWNFPLWLFRIITHTASVASNYCLLWTKLFFIICAHIMSLYCAKIVWYFTKDKEASISAFFYNLGSGTLFMSIAFFGQDEVVYMALFVAAVYYILCGRKWVGCFLGCLSCTLCTFMLVPCFIFLLAKEKNY